MALVSWLVLLVAILGGLYLAGFFSSPPFPPTIVEDAWWGRTDDDKSSLSDTKVAKFVVNVSDDELSDLKQRLLKSRLKVDLDNPLTFEYGFRTATMKTILKHWQEKYDWRKYENQLNSFDQYKTRIEGIDVHFLHVKPESKSKVQPVPLLLVHGWPGSIWEFHKIIPLLTTSSDDEEDVVFEVICPSIPGYGFSEAPHQGGFNVGDAARVFLKLMKRLGHEKFYVQGGDWGAAIVTTFSQLYPQNVLGMHVNFIGAFSSLSNLFKQYAVSFVPQLFGITDDEYIRLYPMWDRIKLLLQESGYLHLHATKPDTIGFALNDSPMGLAAYILEKFSTWTNIDCREKEDGCLLDESFPFSVDDLLTNVMVYWITESITSSIRFYKDNFASAGKWDSIPVTVPTGFASFPKEITPVVRCFLSSKFENVVQFTRMPRGGHFAAFEVPQLLADDIRSFVKLSKKMAANKL